MEWTFSHHWGSLYSYDVEGSSKYRLKRRGYLQVRLSNWNWRSTVPGIIRCMVTSDISNTYLMCYIDMLMKLIVNHCGIVTPHGVRYFGHYWFGQWLVTFKAPTYSLKQYWRIVGKIFQWNFHQNTNIFFPENGFEAVVYNLSSISFPPHCVKLFRHSIGDNVDISQQLCILTRQWTYQ